MRLQEQRVIYLWGEEGDGSALLSSSRSSPYAMCVVLDGIGHVIVDNKRNIWDVNASSCYIRGDQHIVLLFSEASQAGLSLILQE